MEKDEQDYIKAFNNGYFLAKYQPELLNKIANNLNRNDPYCDGLLSGKEQHDIEKAKSYFKKFEKGDVSQQLSKDKSKDKGDKGLDIGR